MPDRKKKLKLPRPIFAFVDRVLSIHWLSKLIGIKKGQPSSFHFAHWFFGRSLGLVSLIAFASYWYQADALVGENGIVPWPEDLERIEKYAEESEGKVDKWNLRPTLLWLAPAVDLHLLFAAGTLASLLLTIGFVPLVAGIVCYLCYLSVMVVGEPFLSFQWDILLVESLLLALPFLPAKWFHSPAAQIGYSNWARLLVLALLAKLMLESGIVKFTYFDIDGSNTWIDGTALNYHYWTQPIPHGLSPWIDSLPDWFDLFSLYFMYAVEILLPFFFFLPGNFRRIALIGQVALQLAIMLSGNYGFFNLLTLALCIPLMDDRMLPSRFREMLKPMEKREITWKKICRKLALAALSFIFLVTTWAHLSSDLKGNRDPEAGAKEGTSFPEEIRDVVRPSRTFNSYGLFRVMTRTRPEIVIEGSEDGQSWQTYQFRWKPTELQEKPSWAGPHMPRIDWQMWFEGLNAERHANHPFSRFLYGRFLDIMANGGSTKECFDLRLALGEQEFRALANANPNVQKQAIANFNALMNAFHARSKWFGSFLHGLCQERQEILDQLEEVPNFNGSPAYLRISIKHYEFASHKTNDEKVWWQAKEIPGAIYLIKNSN